MLLSLQVSFRKIEPHLKNEKLLRIFRLVFPNLKHAPTLLCILLVRVQVLVTINELRFDSSHANKLVQLRKSLEISKPFSMVVCFVMRKTFEDQKWRNQEIEIRNAIRMVLQIIELHSAKKMNFYGSNHSSQMVC